MLIVNLAGFRVSLKTHLWLCLGEGSLEDLIAEGTHTPNMSGPIPRREASGQPCW